MKHLLLSFCLLTGWLAGQAQGTKPTAMDFGFGFRLTGLSTVELGAFSQDAFMQPQLLLRFYPMEQLATRLRLGVNGNDSTSEYTITFIDSVRRPDPFTVDSATVYTRSQTVISFAPGAEWHFKTDNKLDPYAGLEVPFAIKTTEEIEVDQQYSWTVEGGIPIRQEDINTKRTTDGGFSIGVNLLAGFNYFFSPNLAVGAEYSLGFLSTTDGGNVRVATTGTLIATANPDDVTVINDTQTFQQSTAVTSLQTNTGGAVNLSLFF